ncbi:MAG TPA: aldo/keto reductase [Pyrinomonadaceae bacterium]|nr:aldo/keto reductase [Pyrinomonadaceae bacterium]
MSRKKINRRKFMEGAAVSVTSVAALSGCLTAAPAAAKLPRRALGRTNASVSVLAFGCGSRFMMYRDEAEAARVINEAIDAGITYLDTAAAYGDGLSETRLGPVLKSRRREVWLASKIPERSRTRDAALREAEQSLKRLQTDHFDLLHIHSLTSEEDLARIEAPNGVLKALYELREQKVARFIGMTSHTDGAVMAKAIERHDLDCVQMAMNPARANNFEELALPAARKKNLGVILMKVTAQEKILGAGPGRADIKSLVRYALGLPGVATAVIGMPRREHLAENVEIASNFQPLTQNEIIDLRQRVAPAQARVEQFFAQHHDDHLV